MNANSKRKGRRGGLQEARELIGLLGALSREGDTVDAGVISKRLGITLSEAQKLMTLLETVGVDTYTPLSLYSDSEGTLSVAFTNGIHGTALRLTKPETVALNAALNYLQIPADDTLRLKIHKTLGNQDINIGSIERAIAPAASAPVEESLRTIAGAIADQQALSFYYKGNTDEIAKRRDVIPRYVQHDDNTWLLQTYDLHRKAERTFRVDRMSLCNTEKTPRTRPADATQNKVSRAEGTAQKGMGDTENSKAGTQQAAPTEGATPRVTLFIRDETVLQEYSWPGLKVVKRDDNGITATIPYYGDQSPWLPRMLAACGKRVRCSDAHITELTQNYAHEQLALRKAQRTSR